MEGRGQGGKARTKTVQEDREGSRQIENLTKGAKTCFCVSSVTTSFICHILSLFSDRHLVEVAFSVTSMWWSAGLGTGGDPGGDSHSATKLSE